MKKRDDDREHSHPHVHLEEAKAREQFPKVPFNSKNKVSAIYIQNFLHTYTHAFVTSKCLKWQHGKINTGSSLSCLTNILKNINTVILRKVHNFLITLPQTTLIREILYISVFKRAMAFLVLPWVTQNIAKKASLKDLQMTQTTASFFTGRVKISSEDLGLVPSTLDGPQPPGFQFQGTWCPLAPTWR